MHVAWTCTVKSWHQSYRQRARFCFLWGFFAQNGEKNTAANVSYFHVIYWNFSCVPMAWCVCVCVCTHTGASLQGYSKYLNTFVVPCQVKKTPINLLIKNVKKILWQISGIGWIYSTKLIWDLIWWQAGLSFYIKTHL